MKGFIVGVFLSVSHLLLQAGETEKHTLWMDLSAKCQNVARGLAGVGPHTDPNALGLDADLVAIDVLLDQLVEAGDLVEFEILIKEPSEMTQENGEDLINFVKTLAVKYGFYTASEMMDIGFRLELKPIAADKPLLLRLRVPPKTGEEFKVYVKERELAAEKE